jgi:DNA-binding transcriptional LysR family regulator
MLDLRRLCTLREVARHGSFSAAAAALHYTQAAVSQQIGALERETGVALVDRSVRPARLTDAGQRLVEHTEALLGRLAAAEAELEAIAEARAGRLRVGYFASSGPSLLAPAVARFREERPGVAIVVSEGEPGTLLPLVRAGELDAAVVYAYPGLDHASAEVESAELLRDAFALVAPCDHALARADSVALVDLAGEPLIVPRGTGRPSALYLRALERACAEAGFSPRVAYEIGDVQTALAFAAAGLGVALLPGLAVPRDAAGVRVRELSGAPWRSVRVARLAAAPPSAASAAFVELLTTLARSPASPLAAA